MSRTAKSGQSGGSGNSDAKSGASDGLPLEVKCPRCGIMAPYRGNPNRPFCSERCQLSDRAAWADGAYTFPSEDAPGYDSDEG